MGTPVLVANSAESASALIDQRCVVCHSDQTMTAGLSLEGLDAHHVSADAAVWETADFEKQVRRMLDDPRSEALVENSAGQWLYLRNVMGKVEPDEEIFPQFDAELRRAMARETELFFGSVLREDRSVLTLLDSDDTFLNETLAEHYGIKGVHGPQFRAAGRSGRIRGHATPGGGNCGRGSQTAATRRGWAHAEPRGRSGPAASSGRV